MVVELTSNEIQLIVEALSDSIATHESVLKDLTEPDERYERNDVQNKLVRLTKLHGQLTGGKLCHATH